MISVRILGWILFGDLSNSMAALVCSEAYWEAFVILLNTSELSSWVFCVNWKLKIRMQILSHAVVCLVGIADQLRCISDSHIVNYGRLTESLVVEWISSYQPLWQVLLVREVLTCPVIWGLLRLTQAFDRIVESDSPRVVDKILTILFLRWLPRGFVNHERVSFLIF